MYRRLAGPRALGSEDGKPRPPNVSLSPVPDPFSSDTMARASTCASASRPAYQSRSAILTAAWQR
jgi:hypothetical protein